MKLALWQWHSMTNSTVTPVTVAHNLTPAFWVARLRREGCWDGTIHHAVGHELVVTRHCAAHKHGYEYPRQDHVNTSAVMLAYHERVYSASRTRVSSGASTGLVPSVPAAATIFSSSTRYTAAIEMP